MRPAIYVTLAVALAACSPAPPPATKASLPPPVKILQFYAWPAMIARGDRTLLCYGVEGAALVRLDPALEEIGPSRARCINAKPAVSTRYTLYAKSRTGEEVSQQIEVVIDPHQRSTVSSASQSGGLILFFSAGVHGKVPQGTEVPLCYGVKGAAAVSLSPPVMSLVPSDGICFQVTPSATTDYVLTATSPSGDKDTEAVRVIVE